MLALSSSSHRSSKRKWRYAKNCDGAPYSISPGFVCNAVKINVKGARPPVLRPEPHFCGHDGG